MGDRHFNEFPTLIIEIKRFPQLSNYTVKIRAYRLPGKPLRNQPGHVFFHTNQSALIATKVI